jgi:tRNA-2-methylthio-N6-dimethylallyladenosine synthase
MNYSDSARIKAVLQNCWWEYVDNESIADVVILDTCSVRQKSEDKIRWKLKDIRPDQKIRLTGCMIQHNLNLKKLRTIKGKQQNKWNFVSAVITKEPLIIGLEKLGISDILKDIAKNLALFNKQEDILYINHAFDPLYRQMHDAFPNIELFFRINDVGMLPYVMRALGYSVDHDVDLVNEYTGIIPANANMLFKEATKTAYVPISTGCSQFCAYCIVPYARWLEKNRSLDEIMTEVRSHIAQGAEEIVFLWQIVNKHPDFYQLLKQTCALPGVTWVRYTSPYPTYYSDEIFSLHDREEKLCPHIHMPLQSWSDAILKKMFRWYTADQYKGFVDKIRSLSRPISITSDIIVWFSDETDEDFLQSVALTEYSRFDMVYIGIYSPRPWTLWAKKYSDNVPQATKKQRRTALNDVLTRISHENNTLEIGSVRSIIVKEQLPSVLLWYSDNMKNVVIHIDGDEWHTYTPGSFTTATITSAEPFKLFAQLS